MNENHITVSVIIIIVLVLLLSNHSNFNAQPTKQLKN